MKCPDCGVELKKSIIDGEDEEICVNPVCPTPCDSCGKQMLLIGEHWYCRTKGCPDYQYTEQEVKSGNWQDS